MKEYSVSAQVYNIIDDHKQTLLVNETISASSKEEAAYKYQHQHPNPNRKVVKIYSVEQI
jgi:hypothetical protein